MQDTTTIHLEPGTPVVALDGKHLGKVKEVSDTYFKVDAPMRRDYLLTCNEVMSADQEQALLLIPSDELNLYKMNKPGHSAINGIGPGPDLTASRQKFNDEMMGR